MNIFKHNNLVFAFVIFFAVVDFGKCFAIENFASGGRVAGKQDITTAGHEGILFACAPERIGNIKRSVEQYLSSQGITPNLFIEKFNKNNGNLSFTLNTPEDDFDTLQFKAKPGFRIQDETVSLPGSHGKKIQVETVSKKEILLALMQHGRLTIFEGNNCSAAALKEHVGIRQNIVAWAENLNWDWPDGDYAKWNNKYWRKGTPLPGVKITRAFADAFKHQDDYSIGCYTATKLVVTQGWRPDHRHAGLPLFVCRRQFARLDDRNKVKKEMLLTARNTA